MLAFLKRGFDWFIPSIGLILAVISVATIYTITYVTVGNGLAQSQIIYLLIGFILFFIFSAFDYRNFKDVALALFIFSIAVSIPLLPFLSDKAPLVICEFSSCRWIDLGFFRFQTSEVVKLCGIIFLAKILCDKVGNVSWWQGVFILIVVTSSAFLISQQPDLGSAIVIFISGVAVLFAARLKWWFWLIFVIFGLAASPFIWHNLKPYQKKRIEIFLDPSLDPSKTGYNVRQAEIAVGSGGMAGQGFGQGSQSQLNFLPVAHTDFIFAGYAEATGLVGSLFLLTLYAVLILRGLRVAQVTRDSFGRLLIIGIVAQLGVQIVINIGMNIGLLPVTGVPLPLVSFGGTSVFITLIALGIIESVSIRQKTLHFD